MQPSPSRAPSSIIHFELAVTLILTVPRSRDPAIADAALAAGFDLQLSGHTQGGQFWLWNLFVSLQPSYTAGLIASLVT